MTYLVILRTLFHLYLNVGVDSIALFPAEPAVSLVHSFFLSPHQLLPLECLSPCHLAYTFFTRVMELPSLVAKLCSLFELACCVQVHHIRYPTTYLCVSSSDRARLKIILFTVLTTWKGENMKMKKR